MRLSKDIDRRVLGSFGVIAAIVVALLAAVLAAPADAQGKPDDPGPDGGLVARLAALEELVAGQAEQLAGQAEQLAGQGEQLAGQAEQLAGQGEQLAEQGEQLAEQGEQLAANSEDVARLAGMVDSQAGRLVTLEMLVGAFADSACPADEVVTGFADGAPACSPVRTLTSADSAARVVVGADGVAITGADGSRLTLDGSGVDIRSAADLILHGITATLEGDATATVRGGATARVQSGGTAQISGSMVQLGSSSSCLPVARMTDQVTSGLISSGAPTVLVC